MSDEILVQPTVLHLAAGVEGTLEVGGQYVMPGVPQGLDPSELIVPSDYNINGNAITKISGFGYTDLIGVRQIPKNQPFSIYGAFNLGAPNWSMVIGVRDNFGRNTVSEVYKYDSQGRFRLYELSNPVGPDDRPCANNEGMRIDSNGQTIFIYHHTIGQFRLIDSFPIPEDVEWFKFYYSIAYAGNSWYYTYMRVDEATIPVTTSNTTLIIEPQPPAVTQRIIDSTHFGLIGLAIGATNAKLHNDHIAVDVIVPIDITPLWLKPIGQDCGGYAITGQIVPFETNGGLGGIFTATGGTILSGLKWQAPTAEGDITLSYTVNEVTATCLIHVVNKLSVNGVNEDGFYADMAQGEMVQFVSSCPDATFASENYPNIITHEGRLVAPTDAEDDVFGEKDVVVKVEGCFQTYFFRVHIQAMYPIPQFCGPEPDKWKSPLVLDYKVNRGEMQGGTTEAKNRNAVGIATWEVRYGNLWRDAPPSCSCLNTYNHSTACEASKSTAKRLDDFYTLVSYVKYFTVLDYHTRIVYKYVRLTNYEFDHQGLWKTEQTRQLQMRQEGEVLFE